MIKKQNNYVGLKRVLGKATTPSMRRGLVTLRDRLYDFNIQYRKARGWVGTMPDYIIIGAQRSGTTYLYDELIQHPNVAPAFTKEVHYFDVNYHHGIEWYQAFFPPVTKHPAPNSICKEMITGEASPCYVFYPDTARRIYQAAPDVKIILILRDPVKRAYSHYHHEVRLGFETCSFDEAIAMESERLKGEREKLLADETYYGYNYMHFSYLSRGIYADQVQPWIDLFPEEQFLLIRSEDFYQQTRAVMKQVFKFLGLPDWEPEVRGEPKAFPYPSMDSRMREQLREYFEPHNQRLYNRLGMDFGWGK